ncbi:MAG: glycosyl transferase [Betaproteobacteria bacterium]|nr:glycosyl transferase [Betaproteobacteria bacterium]
MTGTLLALTLSGAGAELWMTAALLSLLSFADDRRGLPIAARFGGHIAAALAFVGLGMHGHPWLVSAALVTGVVWVTNLYNFMDGSDGLSGGMAVLGFGAYAVAGYAGHDATIALAGAGIAGAAAGFLVLNFAPARVFMGDAGSVPLGFLAATLGLTGWDRGLWPVWFPVVVFGPFIVDATVTLLRRMLRGERFWRAHRTHYYQRLVQLGWGHRRTALAEYALMLFCAVLALAARQSSPAVAAGLLGFVAVVFAVLLVLVDRAWARHVAAGRT